MRSLELLVCLMRYLELVLRLACLFVQVVFPFKLSGGDFFAFKAVNLGID